MEFKEFDEKDNDNYRNYYLKCIQMTADMTPYNLLSLRGDVAHALRAYAWDLCFHQVEDDGKKIMFTPVGDLDDADWNKIFDEEFPSGTFFWGIPELLMKKWQAVLGDRISVEESRDSWDYIWYTKKMSELEGGQYRSYRRAKKAFTSNYDYTIEKMSPANFDEVRTFHRKMTEELLERTSAAEIVDFDDSTFETALDYWDDKWLYGTIFKVDGEIAGVLINEILDENNIVGLYQKQNRKYEGITEFIYNYDCEYLMDQGYYLYNVMSDAGSEGLRLAKERSHPLRMLKKYNVTVV